MEGVRGDTAAPGEYRRIQNYVVNAKTGAEVYTPPPVHDVPILMSELTGWMNMEHETHPVLISGIVQFQLVHIHPFLDGNGRTSRLLSTLSLYRAGYDFKRLFIISEYYDRNRAALAMEQDLSDRQALALGYLLENETFSIQDFEALCPKVNRRTLQREIKGLVDKKLPTVSGSTNKLVNRLK